MRKLFAAALLAAAAGLSTAAFSQDVIHEDVDGIVNFNRIETTVACAGAIRPDSVARIKELGFHSIINLRLPTEEGANIEQEAAAAKEAGIRFVHLPFGGQELDKTVPDRFLAAIGEPDMEPAFIHCAGGGRAATMWFIKRVMSDGWDEDRALAEATQLGMRPESRLKTFAMDYLAAHGH